MVVARDQEQLQFETLVIDNDYEIARDHYPYIIRRRSNHRVIKEFDNGNGYKYVTLNKKNYYVHRIVALQWIQNDDHENKTQVDHINHDRSDNRLENLRWCTVSDNNYNKTSYGKNTFGYFDELSDLAFELTHHNGHEFENLWFDPDSDCFYRYTGTQFREVHYFEYDSGELYIEVRDVHRVRTRISLFKFKRYFELI